MRLSKVVVNNFRLLTDVDLQFEEKATVIVGRNNSGKTSLTELFRRLLSERAPVFRMEDFSLSVHEKFWQAYLLKKGNSALDVVRSMLPTIQVTLTVSYAADTSDLSLLTDFIVDLDPNCTEAVIKVCYELKDGEIEDFFADIALGDGVEEPQRKAKFCRAIRDRVPKHYACTLMAIDPNDPGNSKVIDPRRLYSLLRGGFINAQRGLDDTTHKDINLLGKVLEALLASAMNSASDSNDKDIAQNLEKAVEEIQTGIDSGFNKQLQEILPAFTLFGYPGLNDPRLLTETTLDVERLLRNHTRVQYSGVNGVNLPEAYNGLGVRNLIFILLKLYEFFKGYKSEEAAPGVHLIFIEEPEVHLHPQMQEVFIDKLAAIAMVFSNKFNNGKPWPVQFVVTTHSSHLANRAAFDAMRYFSAMPDSQFGNLLSTRVKDLRKGLGGVPTEDREFLHKYMTLTRTDLLFADKAILIEGTAERLLVPKMIEKIDEADLQSPQLSSQYVSVVEVGGAYAHLFFGLLDFLEVPSLVVTDLDTVNKEDDGKASKVSEGTGTSNVCLKKWFADENITPQALIAKQDTEKICKRRRIAYQVPEGDKGPCGRSFEDAFILANPKIFNLAGDDALAKEAAAWGVAAKIGKKSDFALEYAISKTNWVVPRYIADGLKWLAGGPVSPAAVGATASKTIDQVPAPEAAL